MRIAMLTSHYLDRTHGGVESHVFYLGEALTALGHDVLVLRVSSGKTGVTPPTPPAFRHMKPPPLAARIQGIVNKAPGRFFREYTGRLASNLGAATHEEILRDFQPDIVHHHDFVENWRLARTVARMSGAPLVWTNHLGETLLLNRSRLGRVALNRLTRQFRLAMAPSMELLEASGSAARKVYYPNGVDTARFHPVSDAERRELRRARKLGEEDFVIVVPRRWAPTKGVRYFAEGLRQVDRPSIEVIFIGAETPGYESYGMAIQEALRDWRIRYRVVATVPATDMPAYYQLADMAVMPSVLEATSLAAMEAMAAGCLVLATRVGGLPEIIEHEVTGLLCSPENPAALLAGVDRGMGLSSTDRLEISSRARAKVVADYSWATIAAKVASEYARVLDEDAA